jgi:DNA-binding transcriptional LysR family regulator
MDYNKLNTFVQVAELGSITQAARHLRRTQSAISQQILLLEEELQFRLLERKSGKIFLSADGERLFRLAKEKFQGIDDEVLKLRNDVEKIEGHIRVGLLSDYMNPFDAGLHIAAFCSRYPKISFSVQYGSSNDIEAKLISNEVDLGFLVYFREPKMFVKRAINQATHRVYGSKAYVERRGPFKTYKDILEADLVDLNDTFACFGTWYQKNSPELKASLLHLRPAVVVPNHRAMAEIVNAGFGLALLPDFLVEELGIHKRCVELVKTAKPAQTGLDVAYRSNKTLKLSERLFIESITE